MLAIACLILAVLATGLLLALMGPAVWAVVPGAVLAAGGAGALLAPFAAGMVAGAMLLLGTIGAATILLVSHGAAWHGGGVTGMIAIALTAPGAAMLAAWQRRRIERLRTELSTTDALLRAAGGNARLQRDPGIWNAFYDPETGLPARRLVLDRFAQMAPQAQRTETMLGLVLFELVLPAEFDAPDAADRAAEALREAGQRLAGVLRSGDTAGRLEGRRFVVLLSTLSDAHGLAVAEAKLREAIAAPIPLSGQLRPITPALHTGDALFPRDGEDWDALLTFAERNLNAAAEASRLSRAG